MKFEIEPNGLNLELRQQIKIFLRQLDFLSPLEYNVTKINYWITRRRQTYDSAIVTSTSTPGSMVIEVICFTTSEELTRSITLLCTRSSNRSHVLVPANNKENKKQTRWSSSFTKIADHNINRVKSISWVNLSWTWLPWATTSNLTFL